MIDTLDQAAAYILDRVGELTPALVAVYIPAPVAVYIPAPVGDYTLVLAAVYTPGRARIITIPIGLRPKSF